MQELFDSIVDEVVNRLRVAIREDLQLLLDKKNDEKLLSAEEACDFFQPKISRPTLRGYVVKGVLKERRMGNRVYYMRSELLEAAVHLKRIVIK